MEQRIFLMAVELKKIEKELHGLADDQIAAHSQKFFKTGPGQHGEGDRSI